MRMLGKRISHHDGPNLLEDIMVLPEGEPCIYQPLAYVAPLLEHRVRGQTHGRRIRQVGKGRVSPQRACLAQQPGRPLSVSAVKRCSTLGSEVTEADDVELTPLDQHSVAGPVRNKAVVTSQRTPQITHSDAKRCLRVAWQMITPECIDQLRSRRRLSRP